MAFHPTTGALYALRDVGSGGTDHLLIIDKSTGAVITDVGALTGSGQTVGSGGDLAFDPSGKLYVTDMTDDHLYQINPANGTIIALIDNNEAGGLGVSSSNIRFEGLAWDSENNKLIGTDDDSGLFARLTLENSNNVSFGSVSGLMLTK